MLFSICPIKTFCKRLITLFFIALVFLFPIGNVNARSAFSSVARAVAVLSTQLKSGRFDDALLTARALSRAPVPVNYAASFSEFLCLLFTGKRENLGDDFQEIGRLVETLGAEQKNRIWEFVVSSRLSFSSSSLLGLYKNKKIKNPTHVFDTYLGIAVFLGNLNCIRSIQESQKILFNLLDILEEPVLVTVIKESVLQKQILLGVIQRNQEFLQILTKSAPIEVGQAAM